EDGWWRTGDAGTIDELGYFQILDRLKDLIKSGGEWISSLNLETVLMKHPYVLEAVVIGVQHPRWGERPLALVVLKDQYKGKPKDVIEKDLKQFLLGKFAEWQVPDRILFIDEIPRTSVGKINKRLLREKYRDYYLRLEVNP
ncbi:MAG: AMP-dependent synthetase, partial [Archaeoglobaceae archaeon]